MLWTSHPSCGRPSAESWKSPTSTWNTSGGARCESKSWAAATPGWTRHARIADAGLQVHRDHRATTRIEGGLSGGDRLPHGLYRWGPIGSPGRADEKERVWAVPLAAARGGERAMKVSETPLPGLCIIELDSFGDARGSFMELFQARKYLDMG